MKETTDEGHVNITHLTLPLNVAGPHDSPLLFQTKQTPESNDLDACKGLGEDVSRHVFCGTELRSDHARCDSIP